MRWRLQRTRAPRKQAYTATAIRNENSSETGPSGDATETVYLVDALCLIYRAYHAMSQATLSSPAVGDTRAVYGFVLFLVSLVQEHAKQSRVIVVFEGAQTPEQPGFRNAMYASYKATRPEAPRGVRDAIPWVKRLVLALGLSFVEVDRYEADDVIGSLACAARRDGMRAVIVSTDKDFRQLLDGDWIQILRPGSKARGAPPLELVTEDDFRREFCGVQPAKYVDILALIGDKVDNVPGVPGIGAKSAPKLVAELGSLEDILAEVASDAAVDGGALTKRQRKLLADNRETAVLSKQLVTISTDVELGTFSWTGVSRRRVDRNLVSELASSLAFSKSSVRRMMKIDDHLSALLPEGTALPAPQQASDSSVSQDLQPADNARAQGSAGVRDGGFIGKDQPGGGPDAATGPTVTAASGRELSAAHDWEYLTVASTGDFQDALAEISGFAYGPLGVAVACGPRTQDLRAVALSLPNRKVWIIELEHLGGLQRAALCELLSSPQLEYVAWNSQDLYKRLCEFLETRIEGRFFDLRIAGQLIFAGRSFADKDFARRHVHVEGQVVAELDSLDDFDYSVPESADVAAKHAVLALRIRDRVQAELESTGLYRVAFDIEFPLAPVLGDLERAGVPFDRAAMCEISESIVAQKNRVEVELREIIERAATGAGQDFVQSFKLSSRDHISQLLYDIWKLPVKTKTPKGRPAVDKKVLRNIELDQALTAEQRKFASLLLEHREMTKLDNTYALPLIKAITSEGRIHPEITQDASPSGRISMASPNLQSLPSQSEAGSRIRDTVRPGRGRCIVCADYSQIELRILAGMSADSALIMAFENNQDVHKAVAALVFGVDPGDVTQLQRSRAKAVSFGIPYGISAYGLGEQLGVNTTEAQALIDSFYAAFPGVKALTAELAQRGLEREYAETLCGRIAFLPLIRGGSRAEQKASARLAVNMPIQGTQADMIKLAMVGIARRLRATSSSAAMILQVHDELVFEADDGEAENIRRLVVEEMCRALPLPCGVQVVVNCGVGESWTSAAADAKRNAFNETSFRMTNVRLTTN